MCDTDLVFRTRRMVSCLSAHHVTAAISGTATLQPSVENRTFSTLLALCALTLGACSQEGDSPKPREPEVDAGLICTSCGACEEEIDVTSALHVMGPIDYLDVPPVGGPHSPCWGNWGVQDTPLKPERWVHNLEHGGGVLLYHCPDGCDAEIAELKSFVGDHERTLLTEYDAMTQRFAAVAWEHRLVSDCLDLAAISHFYEVRFNRGPEAISSGPDTVCLERPEL
jgi:hypothetical protein